MKADRPRPAGQPVMGWGSDAIAEMLRRLDLAFASLNPGASFRGLHDSIVNFLGNERPALVLALHEEHAVAIAHGYAKVTERPMAAVVHANVGLMHASMGVFNAWCDRVPLVLLGATGPVDAALRRPWIDWVHTAKDQGALIRDFTKWDDQPASVAAALASLARAHQIARTPPFGPVYVCLDVTLQEQALDAAPRFPEPERHAPPAPPAPDRSALDGTAAALAAAQQPLILAGRVSRAAADWERRVALAERLDAPVLTDLKVGAAFPTTHRLHAEPPGFMLSEPAAEMVRAADVILSLDWLDLGGTLAAALGEERPAATLIHCSLDNYSHRAWSMDHMAAVPADHLLLTTPDQAVAGLLERLGPARQAPTRRAAPRSPTAEPAAASGAPTLADIAGALERARGQDPISLVQFPGEWPAELCRFEHPLDYLGRDGGAGIGSGPGLAVGAALALTGTGRFPVTILGDGDFLMGATALWTAAHYRLPLLVIVANNRTYMNDERHQASMALRRNRPVENKWIGLRLEDPAVDIAALARAQGAAAEGPIAEHGELDAAIARGFAALRQGGCYVIDVLIADDRAERATA